MVVCYWLILTDLSGRPFQALIIDKDNRIFLELGRDCQVRLLRSRGLKVIHTFIRLCLTKFFILDLIIKTLVLRTMRMVAILEFFE